MALSYNKLWKLMIDKNMKKMELRDALQMSNTTLAKLGKNEPVSMFILMKICDLLQCNLEDIVEYIPDPEGKPEQE